MRLKTGLLLLLLVLTVIGVALAGRSGGGRTGGGRTGGGRTSSGSRSSSSGWFGRFSGRTSSSNHGSSTPSRNTAPTSFGNHGTSSTSGKPATTAHKDVNTPFLNAEGGGAIRPSKTQPLNTHPSAPPSNTHPSAPPANTHPSAPPANTHPSAPPAHPMFENGPHNPMSGHTNPPWSNPHIGTGHVSTVYQTSHVGSRVNNANHSISHGAATLQTGRNPPYPITHGSSPGHPVTQSPGIGFKESYLNRSISHGVNTPLGGRNPPYPTTHVGTSPPHPGQHMGGQSFPPMGYPHPSVPNYPGHAHYPGASQHPNPIPLGNPYSTYPVSGTPGAYGQPHYVQQPQVLAQPAAQPFVPGQTVIMMPGQQDSGRGVGQILKEALIFSTVNAGVNRLINGPSHHHVVESKPADPGNGGGATHVTYNNYYNTSPGSEGNAQSGAIPGGNFPQGNVPSGIPGGSPTTSYFPPNVGMPVIPPSPGSTNNVNVPSGNNIVTSSGGSVPVAGAAAAGGVVANTGSQQPNSQGNAVNNAPVSIANPYKISNEELYNITEQLFAKQAFNVSKYLTLNLQTRTTSPNVTDQAKEPLLFVQPELLDYPSISVTRALFDNYEHESHKKENRTIEKRKEENLLIDTFLNTNIMSSAMQWLADKGFIDPDDFERKDILRHVWFTHFGGTSCGFERVFMSEKYGDTALLGVQDWLYFDYQESLKRIDYMGYTDKLNLGNSSSLLKLNFQMDGIIRQNATIFVGTLPELEMSLYTICFYARPNDLCPVSLGGSKFNIFTHSFRYFGNDLIDLAVVIF